MECQQSTPKMIRGADNGQERVGHTRSPTITPRRYLNQTLEERVASAGKCARAMAFVCALDRTGLGLVVELPPRMGPRLS